MTTSTATDRSALAHCSPPKPPPITTTRGVERTARTVPRAVTARAAPSPILAGETPCPAWNRAHGDAYPGATSPAVLRPAHLGWRSGTRRASPVGRVGDASDR